MRETGCTKISLRKKDFFKHCLMVSLVFKNFFRDLVSIKHVLLPPYIKKYGHLNCFHTTK